MPLIKRCIMPIDISRGVLPPNIKDNELTCISNNTLSNIVLQLSSLSLLANDLFGELFADVTNISQRSNAIYDRLEKLKQKIVKLNPTVEEVLLQEINQRKHFKSQQPNDQQVISLMTRPEHIAQIYMQCEAPPPLSKLDSYRSDGKDSIRFYTDPGYFVELWILDMKNQQQQQRKQKLKHKQSKPMNKPKTIRAPHSRLDDFRELRHGPEFVDNLKQNFLNEGTTDFEGGSDSIDNVYRHSNGLSVLADEKKKAVTRGSSRFEDQKNFPMQDQNGPLIRQSPLTMRPSLNNDRPESTSNYSTPRPHFPPPMPPSKTPTPCETPTSSHTPILSRNKTPERSDLPSPPPLPPDYSRNVDNSGANMSASFYRYDLPPPPSPPYVGTPTSDIFPTTIPPPPPLANDIGAEGTPPPPAPLLPSNFNDAIIKSKIQQSIVKQPLTKTASNHSENELVNKSPTEFSGGVVRDNRSDLLSAIRTGIQLRKVEEDRKKIEKRDKGAPKTLDVQSMMEAAFEMRRRALEDDDDEEDEDKDDEEEEW